MTRGIAQAMSNRFKNAVIAAAGGIPIDVAAKGYELGLCHGALHTIESVEGCVDALNLGEKGAALKAALYRLSVDQAEKARNITRILGWPDK